MKSLKTLATLNWVFAVIYVAAGAFMLFVMDKIATATSNRAQSGGDPFLIFGAFIGGFILVSVVVHGWVALALPDGRGRILQTILAVIHAANFPLGTGYAAWAGWLCWLNPETTRAFEHPRQENESDDQWADRLYAVAEEAPAALPVPRRRAAARPAAHEEAGPVEEDDERTEPRGQRR